MNQSKHYFAFISHSTSDQKKAIWLRNKLEHYHIPTSVQDEVYSEYKGLKQFKPCFIYQTDLAGGVLSDALKKELSDSHYLIIVCSPEAAKSEYVNKEARHFIRTGRANKIIPYIIKGQPDECFPDALKDLAKGRLLNEETGEYQPIERLELRGINSIQISKDLHSKMAPVVNVIATMLGVRFDSLWDRFRRKRRMRNTSIGIAATVLLFAGLFIWNRSRPEYRYYADFVECKGVPQGLYPISNEMQKERSSTYRFQYEYLSLFDKERHLTQIECVNSFGFPVDLDTYFVIVQGLLRNRAPIIKFKYNDEYQITSALFCDSKGNPQNEYVYRSINLQGGNAFIADIVSHSYNYDNKDFVNMEERMGKSNVRRVLYKTDDKGFIRSVSYHANNGNLKESQTMNDDGVYGYELVLDSLHRPISITAINEEKKRMNDINGVNRTLIEYDHFSKVKVLRYFDKNDKPERGLWNFHKYEGEYDQYGNVVKETTYDEKGNVCISKQGDAIQQLKYYKGCWIELECFDELGNKTNNTDNVWKTTREIDHRGNCVKVCYYDTNDELTNNKDGWSIGEYKYDNNNNCIEKVTYDKSYSLTLSKKKGDAKIVVKYDKYGRLIEGTSYGIDGEKTINKFGYCMEKFEYGKIGNVSLWECFDTEGKRICCKDGYAISRSAVLVDELGNQIITGTFFDGDEKAVMNNKFKFHKYEFTLDGNGNLIEQRYYDTENKLFNNGEGYAVARYKYDSKGRMIQAAFYDENELPTNNNKGFSIMDTSYPNDTTSVMYYKDPHGRLCMTVADAPIAEIVQSGDTVIKSCYDTLHNLCMNRDGYAISKEVFDKQKKTIAGFYYGVDANPIKRFDSIAGFRYINDKRGNLLEEIFLGKDKKPANCLSGFAITESKYDERDNRIECSIYDQDDYPVIAQLSHSHKMVFVYDDRDQPVDCRLYDDNDELYSDPSSGYACSRHQFDLRGNTIETTYWDEYLDPTTNLYGIHKEQFEYDNKNHLVLIKYYDEYDNLTPGPDGNTAIIEQMWDDRNNVAQKAYFDADSALLGTEMIAYNQYGCPKMVRIQTADDDDIVEMSVTPYAYVVNGDMNNVESYAILEWENWNITNQIDYYVSELLKSRMRMKKRMIVMDYSGQIKEVVFDENSIIDIGKIPEQDFKTICNYYLQWKKMKN